MSQSTLKVTLHPTSARGPSPTPDIQHRLQIPKARNFPCQHEETKYTWGEEEVELIRTCGILASSLGLSKSLSTSDISIIDVDKNIRPWVSEENLNTENDRFDGVFPQKLEPMSRSCSTWVAVGDVTSTSQLPSPQTRIGGCDSPAITAVDFILSVNKKVRQNYIRRRLQISYRLLKRISLENDNPDPLVVPKSELSQIPSICSPSCAPREVISLIRREGCFLPSCPVPGSPSSLTAKEVERDRGRQLSRYERNMIIFNWLQTLEGGEFEPTA